MQSSSSRCRCRGRSRFSSPSSSSSLSCGSSSCSSMHSSSSGSSRRRRRRRSSSSRCRGGCARGCSGRASWPAARRRCGRRRRRGRGRHGCGGRSSSCSSSSNRSKKRRRRRHGSSSSSSGGGSSGGSSRMRRKRRRRENGCGGCSDLHRARKGGCGGRPRRKVRRGVERCVREFIRRHAYPLARARLELRYALRFECARLHPAPPRGLRYALRAGVSCAQSGGEGRVSGEGRGAEADVVDARGLPLGYVGVSVGVGVDDLRAERAQ
ncbi:hypothetical protein T492DRAFT_1070963 [Pavlovales sp. CCMP2436]|nr:hypothetical protein T492DRAFT_1070963 [Pavlovales sp. CCMP2436]